MGDRRQTILLRAAKKIWKRGSIISRLSDLVEEHLSYLWIYFGRLADICFLRKCIFAKKSLKKGSIQKYLPPCLVDCAIWYEMIPWDVLDMFQINIQCLRWFWMDFEKIVFFRFLKNFFSSIFHFFCSKTPESLQREDEAMEETETDEISPDSFYETMDEEDSNLKADSEIINGDNHQNLVKMIAQEDTTNNPLADNSLRSSVSQNLCSISRVVFSHLLLYM